MGCWIERGPRGRRQSGAVSHTGRPLGVALLSLFFAAGTIAAVVSAAALAWPGTWSEAVWRIKPEAPEQFARLGTLAIPLMLMVAVACLAAAIGLATRKRWGHRIALGLVSANLLGDSLNALLRGDWRTLVGMPIGGAMLAYLLSARVHGWFRPPLRAARRQDL